MKPENEINEEVQQLLDTLEEHGRNARRQKRLNDLIDNLEASGTPTPRSARNDAKRRKLYPLWWALGAAAACLLFWLLVEPTTKQAPEMEEKNLVEKVEATDSMKVEKNDVVIEEPIVVEEFLAEEKPIVPQKTQIRKEKPKKEIIEEAVEQPVFAEVTPTEPKDTTNTASNTIPTINETPVIVQKPQRRVIRSLNLVCYECQKDPEPESKIILENKTLFGQPQDPNMKNGALAFEIKLN